MICKPKSFYDEKNKVAIGYKNPLYLTRAKQVQPALYNGHVLVMSNHARPVECPPDYLKENLLATFAPQRNLTPEQIFWSIDENDRKKTKTSVPKPLSALTVYPLQLSVTLSPEFFQLKVKILSSVRRQLKFALEFCQKQKFFAQGMYAKVVEPFSTPLSNNRSAHLVYINHLKESVETVIEIVKEARVVKPLDTALNSACKYTKLSQELVEYVIGTCPKEFIERDNKAAAFIPVTRKKHVLFTDMQDIC
ncbi:hypothetical protein Tco_0513489 [Tanacetum coccineum]